MDLALKTQFHTGFVYGGPLYGFYFVVLLLGSPPQGARLILDSGSGEIVVNSAEGCRAGNCGSNHWSPFYAYLKSETSEYLQCQECPDDRCIQGHCFSRHLYNEGSLYDVFAVRESVGLKGLEEPPKVRVRVATTIRETGLLANQKPDGIFGIGRDSQIPKFLAPYQKKVLGICLNFQGGNLYTGGYPLPAAQLSWLSSPSFGLTWSGARVHGPGLAFEYSDPIRVALDSGTTVSGLPPPVFQMVLQGLSEKLVAVPPVFPIPGDLSCFERPDQYDDLPTISFWRNKTEIQWRPQQYLINVEQITGKPQVCLFARAKTSPFRQPKFLLGSTFFVNRLVVKDYASRRIGLADMDCPTRTFDDLEPTPEAGPLVERKALEDLEFLKYSHNFAVAASLLDGCWLVIGGFFCWMLVKFVRKRWVLRYNFLADESRSS